MSSDDNPILHTERIVPGDTWSCVLKRGQRLTLTDTTGDGNCAMLAFNARNTSERYNMPDTLKGQHTAKLTTGNCLYSDMGRVLLSIIADDLGWHDPLGAITDAQLCNDRFGERSYAEHRNGWTRNTRDNLMVELGKYGLGPRDWHAVINWFSSIQVSDAEVGRMHYLSDNKRAGQSVTVRAELEVLVLLSATQHPLHPADNYQPREIIAHIQAGDPAGPQDTCRLHCPENGRAYALTEQAALAL